MAEEKNEVSEIQNLHKKLVQSSLHAGVLAKGLHEVCKAIEAKQATLCILAENCDEKNYVKLVKALCKENEVPILTVNEAELLGEWIGICKRDAAKNIRKRRKCSSMIIKEYPQDFTPEEIDIISKEISN